jgi:hypothetical protein
MIIEATCGVSFSNDSGKSSLIDIQIMAHHANQRLHGKNGVNFVTNKNAGTAISGCGKLEKVLRNAALRRLTQRQTITKLIANHSGTFCIAIARVINIQKFTDGQYAAQRAIHSVKECAVITHIISNNLRASIHFVVSNFTCSYLLKKISDKYITITHNTTQPKVDQDQYSNHWNIIPKLAPIINQAAIACAQLLIRAGIFFVKINGNAPSQQAIAVANQTKKIVISSVFIMFLYYLIIANDFITYIFYFNEKRQMVNFIL